MYQQTLFEVSMEFSILLKNRKSKTSVITYSELKTLSVFSQTEAPQIRQFFIDSGIKSYLDSKDLPWITTDNVNDWLQKPALSLFDIL